MKRRSTERQLPVRWKSFRYGQSFVDAIRNTLCVLLPLILFFYLGLPEIAVEIGTGALLIGLADLPGNRSDKVLSAWTSLLLYFVIAAIVGMAQHHVLIIVPLLAVLAFMLTMFSSFGQRLGAVGAIGLVVATFTFGLRPSNPLSYALYVTLGGVWYYLISLLQVWLFPYHPLQRAIAKCRQQTAELLRLRAIGYDPSASLSGFNKRNISLHLKITISHELIRRLLLGDRFALRHQDQLGAGLLNVAITLIDLYEKISAIHHEYPYLRKKLQAIGALTIIYETILLMATEVEGDDVEDQIEQNLVQLAEIQDIEEDAGNVLTKLLGNLRESANLSAQLNTSVKGATDPDITRYRDFILPDQFSVARLKSHLNFASAIFRFAARLSILMMLVMFVITSFSLGSYAYWLPLTLLVVSRPSYVHTRRRNVERILGTLLGLIGGWVMMKLEIPVPYMLGISAIAIYIFFFYLYSRYWAAAFGITLAVVVCLGVFHGRMEHILLDRLLFTLLGCAIGMLATFFFPIWHSSSLKPTLLRVLQANRNFLQTLVTDDAELGPAAVRLARKESYLALAALSEGISLSIAEPGRRRKNAVALRHVELLCFQCNALISATAIGIIKTSRARDTSNMIDDLDSAFEALKDIEIDQLVDHNRKMRTNEPLDLQLVIAQLKELLSAK